MKKKYNYDSILLNAFNKISLLHESQEKLFQNRPQELLKRVYEIFNQVIRETSSNNSNELVGFYIISFDLLSKKENLSEEYIFTKSAPLKKAITFLLNMRNMFPQEYKYRHSELLFKKNDQKNLTYTRILKGKNKNSLKYSQDDKKIIKTIISLKVKDILNLSKINPEIFSNNKKFEPFDNLFPQEAVSLEQRKKYEKTNDILKRILKNNYNKKENIEYIKAELLSMLSLVVTESKVDSLVYVPSVVDIQKNSETKKIMEYSSGGFVFYIKEENESELDLNTLKIFQILTDEFFRFKNIKSLRKKFRNKNLKTAIISILVDSFSHNIAAHSLQQILKWLNNRILYSNIKFTNNEFHIGSDFKEVVSKDKVNEFTNLKDDELNLSSLLWYGEPKYLEILKDNINSIREQNLAEEFDQTWPFSFDVFRYQYLKYINGKATFWSGVIKDRVLGGSICNWFELLYEFCYNPYFIGTIAGSENIFKINFRVHCFKMNKDRCAKNNFNHECEDSNFMTINLTNLMSHKDAGRLIVEGDNFASIKKELEKKPVFLPGGDVGKHALYTIFENKLRNVKHCEHFIKNDSNNKQIEFNINILENGNNKNIYDVNIWLTNKSDFAHTINVNKVNGNFYSDKLKKIDKSNIKVSLKHNNCELKEFDIEQGIIKVFSEIKVKYRKNVIGELNKIAGEPIVEEQTLKPRMGGSTQDKICAAQLLTNDFINVDKDYKINNKKINFINYSEYKSCENRNEKFKGHLATSFRVWRGNDLGRIDHRIDSQTSKKQEEQGLILYKRNIIENLRRFRLFVAKDKTEQKHIESLGVVRVIRETELNKDDKPTKFEKYYNQWLDEWLKDYRVKIQGTGKPFWFASDIGNWEFQRYDAKESNTEYHEPTFTHNENDDYLSIKNQGIAGKEFFEIDDYGEINNLKCLPDKIKQKELLEIFGTQIVAVDNRIHNYISAIDKSKQFAGDLNLSVFSEGKDIREGLQTLDELKKLANYTYPLHFLIIHLAFIEKINNNIVSFIDNYLKTESDKYLFKKLVITTGRGRDEWLPKVKKVKSLKDKVIFLPPESLTSAISYGIAIKDEFEVKARLIKLLMN